MPSNFYWWHFVILLQALELLFGQTHRQTEGRTADGRTDRRGSQNSYLDIALCHFTSRHFTSFHFLSFSKYMYLQYHLINYMPNVVMSACSQVMFLGITFERKLALHPFFLKGEKSKPAHQAKKWSTYAAQHCNAYTVGLTKNFLNYGRNIYTDLYWFLKALRYNNMTFIFERR